MCYPKDPMWNGVNDRFDINSETVVDLRVFIGILNDRK